MAFREPSADMVLYRALQQFQELIQVYPSVPQDMGQS